MKEPFGYDELIQSFLDREIDVSTFERAYIDKYLNHPGLMDDGLFYPLDELFYFVDCYTDLPPWPGYNPDHYINEDQLRVEAARILNIIRELK